MTIAEARVVGHLTQGVLAAELERVERVLDRAPDGACAMLFDATEMTGYDPAARSLFVDFNRRVRARLCRVAIVTDNALWRMVISAMAVASGQQMKPFATADAARDWLRESKVRPAPVT